MIQASGPEDIDFRGANADSALRVNPITALRTE